MRGRDQVRFPLAGLEGQRSWDVDGEIHLHLTWSYRVGPRI